MKRPERRRFRRHHHAGQLPTFFLGILLLFVPAIVGAADALRVAVISDLNGSYGTTDYEASVDNAVTRIIELKPDLVISTGDMVAGQRRPHLTKQEVERMWTAFHQHVSDRLAAAGIPLAVTPGNHDGSAYEGFEQERAIYSEQWQPRKPKLHFLDEGNYPFFYAFESGDTLFVSLDATKVGHLPDTQMTWLRGVLARHGPTHRHRVVFSHVPLWPFAQGRESEFIGDPHLESLIRDADIDLYLSGHHHAFYPGAKDGTAFVSQSCLGAGPRRLIGEKSKSPQSFTLLEIAETRIGVAAYPAPRFDAEIDWPTLPDRLRSAAATFDRADLVAGKVGRLTEIPTSE